MAGSRGKQSKSKAKQKSKKSEPIEELDFSFLPGKSFEGPQANDENPHASVTEDNLEELLYAKVEDLYTKAKAWLCILYPRYSESYIDLAILRNGHFHGPKDALNNILFHSVDFLEKNYEPRTEGFLNINDLCKTVRETMICFVMRKFSNMTRVDAMWHLLDTGWGCINPATSHLQSQNQNVNAGILDSFSAFKKVPSENRDSLLKSIQNVTALKSRLEREVPVIAACIEYWPSVTESQFLSDTVKVTEASANMDPYLKEFITSFSCEGWPRNSLVSDLVESIRSLQEEVKAQKEWAQRQSCRLCKKVK